MTSSDLIFFVNGIKIIEKDVNPEWTLLYYLRNKLKLCGTKLGCGEGGCGACTVMISRYDWKHQTVRHLAINACLAPICSMHGLAVTTIEGIGSTTKLHPVQERIAKSHGLQCGFCTPGIAMSMYTLLRNCSSPSMKDLQTSFQGNLCRCTGYRPIIEGFKSFTSDNCLMGQNCCQLSGGEDTKLFSPSKCLPYDPTQEPIFPPELKLCDTLNHQDLTFRGENVTWYRPTTLSKLLELKEEHRDGKIVGGNTEIGVETKIKRCLYPILIQPSVPELNVVRFSKNGVTVGASITLLEMEEVINDLIKSMPGYKTRIFVAIKDILHWFGGKQIRGVASLGGNIMTSSPISDLNPIFLAAEVQLELHSKLHGRRFVTMDSEFFTGYRKNAVKNDEVLVAIHIPFTLESQYFYSYKQSRRRDDDIAVVNFALNVVFQPSSIVQKVCLAFGGMAATTVTVPRLHKYLVNKPWNVDTLNVAYKYLSEDLLLPADAPGGLVEYRRALTLSLFFKAFLRVSEQLTGTPIKDKSAIVDFETRTPKSAQFFDVSPSKEKTKTVGLPLPHNWAFNVATGEAVYCDDIPTNQNEAYMALVISTKAHAKILEIDATEALKCKGVRAFFSYQDLPEGKNRGGVGDDEEIFVSDIVQCHGLTIGVVIADDQAIAQNAAAKVNVKYQELEPVIVTIEDAISHNSFHDDPQKIVIGDIDKVFQSAPHMIEGDCRTGAQEHFYLETHSVVAVPTGEDGEMEIFCSTQDAAGVTNAVARLLNVPQHRIVTRVKRLGGSFGGKDSRSIALPVLAAFAAHKLNFPVRCMLNRNEDMVITGTRHPFYVRYKTAFNGDGKILGSEVMMYSNAGYSKDLSFYVLERAMDHVDNAYKIPAIRITGYVCKTNLPSFTAFRGFGAPQAMFAGETMIRHVAEYLHKDIFEVAHLNFYTDGDLTTYDHRLTDCNLGRCWDECITSSDFKVRKQQVEEFNRENRWKKRGISLVPTRYGVGVNIIHYNQAGALIHVYTDGSVLLNHAGVEMGQGLHTKMIQIASTVLEVPYTAIHICETSTNKVPNASPTVGSLGSDLCGGAVKHACEIINKRLEPYKRQKPEESWKDWVVAAYKDRVSLSATGFFVNPCGEFGHRGGPGYNYHSYGVSCTEVEIDCLTGDHQVLRTDIVMDVGQSLNPAIDIGQIEGGFMQGYGLFVQEEMLYSPKGEVLSKGPGTYKIPSFGNMPLEFNVSLLKDSSNPKAVYSSKAIGEPPLFLSCSVLFAIREAIISARIDAGLGADGFKLDAPATAARIRMGCQDHLTDMVKVCNPPGTLPWNVIP